MPEFQPYLDEILSSAHESEDWRANRCVPTEAQLPLHVRTIVDKHSEDSDLNQETPRPYDLLNGLREFYTREPVLLIGKPGSGKSTALRRLQLEEAEICKEALRQDPVSLPRIPVLILLRSCDQGDVLDWIAEELEDLDLEKSQIRSLLKDGRLLLLFDGLNEVPNPNVYRSLSNFLEKRTRVPIVFTTRELGADSALGISRKLEMMPLSVPQMQDFIEKRLPGRSDEMLRQLGDRLRQLAETPLLLNILCQVFEKSGEIPKNRGELFRNKFIQDFDAIKHKGVVAADSAFFDYKDEILQYLAMKMIVGDGTPEGDDVQVDKSIAQDWIAEYLTNKQVSDARGKANEWLQDLLEHHILQIANKIKNIEFHHQLFQEYYAAEWLLGRVEQLEDEILDCDYLNYLKWTEPLALMLALVDDEALAVRVVERSLAVDLMLGARLAGEVRSDFQTKTAEFVDAKVPNLLKAKCVTSLTLFNYFHPSFSFFSPPEYIPPLIESSPQALLEQVNNPNSDYDDVWSMAEALNQIDSGITIPSLLTLVEDPNSGIRWRSAVALGQIGSDKSMQALIKLLVDPDFSVRHSAIEGLGNIGSKIAIPNLLEILVDSDSEMHLLIIKALSKIGFEIATLDLSRLIEDHDSRIREQIAYMLGDSHFVNSISVLLKFLDDSDSDVSWVAADSIRRIANKSKDKITIASYLPHFFNLIPTNFGEAAHHAIKAIQANCKFYNYEIYQKAIDRTSITTARGTPEVLAGIEQTVKQINQRTKQMADQPTISIGTISGGIQNFTPNQGTQNTIDTQNNNYFDSDETLQQQIAELKQIIAELETQHPDITTEPQASVIIGNKFKDLQIKQSPQWQSLLIFKRLYNGGKKATLKLGEHFSQENPWGKAFVAFLEGISEDLK